MYQRSYFEKPRNQQQTELNQSSALLTLMVWPIQNIYNVFKSTFFGNFHSVFYIWFHWNCIVKGSMCWSQNQILGDGSLTEDEFIKGCMQDDDLVSCSNIFSLSIILLLELPCSLLRVWRFYPIVFSRGSQGLSARRAQRTNSRCPKRLQLEVGAQRAN